MSELSEEYCKHTIIGRSYTLAKGNHICVLIATEVTELPNGHLRPVETTPVWFMEFADDRVVFTGQTCDEDNINEKDISVYPDSLVEDVEDEYDVEVVENISEDDIDIPEKSLEIDVTDEELNEKSEKSLGSFFKSLGDIKPEDGKDRIVEFNTKTFDYKLADTKTDRRMLISKKNGKFRIKLLDSEGNKINDGDVNEYKKSEVSGVIDDFKTFIQIQ